MHTCLITLLSAVANARILNYGLSNGKIVAHPVEPSAVAFYGYHHQKPHALCNELTSKSIIDSIFDHIAYIEGFLDREDLVEIKQKYPHLYYALGTDPRMYKQFFRAFRDSLAEAEHREHILLGEELGNYLRDVSIRSLKAVGGLFPDKLPNTLKVENLRTLNADMLHLGGAQIDIYQGIVQLIDCVNVHSLQEPVMTQQQKRDIGYDISPNHTEQDTESQTSDSMITDINKLLSDPDIAQRFHPMADPGAHEQLIDPYYPYQWYLGGPPEQKYGGNFIKAWELMLGIPEGSGFESVSSSDFPKSPYYDDVALTIAIVDMGCGTNDDLLYDASNPICHDDKTLIGNENNVDIDDENVVELEGLSNYEEMGARIKDVPVVEGTLAQGADYCGGASDDVFILNEGHESLKESYFKDPTNHGTSTASVIGAGWNDEYGIAGVCPFCNVKCIKISADASNTAQVNMTGIYRSLEFLATFADRYPISNHSYGGFFLDPREVEGQRRLYEAGGLVVTAAGNYGCDIDPLAKAYGAFDPANNGMGLNAVDSDLVESSICKRSNGELAFMPMMPASIQLPNFMSVGAIGYGGAISKFSNWGKETVTLVAPGETIVSLRARGADFSKGGNDEVLIQHGTSFASPITSAAAALIYRQLEVNCHHPTPEKIIALLSENVTKTTGPAAENKAGGTLNVFEAMKKIENKC